MITLQEIEATGKRIQPYVRSTPLMNVGPVKNQIGHFRQLYLKLECLQITGSFKARGAVNKLLSLTSEQLSRGIVTASGGNHGLGVAYAGSLKQIPVTVYLPRSTQPAKIEKLKTWGAQVILEGEVWDDANKAALLAAEQQQLAYFHAFADPDVIRGQGTVCLEILEDVSDIDILIVATGGGGLIGGMSIVAKSLKPAMKVYGVEPVGAPTLYESLKAGHLVGLPSVQTKATSLASRNSDPQNFEIIQRFVDRIVLVTDEEMLQAASWLWQELGVAAELSGAASIAALMTGQIPISPEHKVCAVICGMGTDGIPQS